MLDVVSTVEKWYRQHSFAPDRKARAHIAELYDLNKIRDDVERLTVIEKLLDHDKLLYARYRL